MRSSARSSGAAASRIFFSFSSSNKKQKQKRAGVVRCDISPEEKKKKKREEDKDIDRAFAMAVFKRWLSSLGVDLSKTEFVSTRSMGIGGVVLRDAEELDLVFRIPLLVPREGRRMPVAMRWDAFIHSSSSASSSSPLLLGFSAELGDIFVKERLESKLRGVLIEDDDDGDAEEEDASNASSSFPLDSTRTSMLALALMYQDVKARSRRRAIELGIDVEADVFWRNQHPPHWQAYVDLLPTNVDSLLMWSTEELAFLQNSRIGERAKRRKKLVQEEFDVLFSNNNNNNNAGLREEFERLTSAAAAVTSAEETSPPLPSEKRRQRRRRRLTPFRFETLQEWFEWSYATVLARAFTLPEIENGALIFCPGLDIFNSARDAAKCEVRLAPHDDISLHATVGGCRAGTQAFHDYADHASGGALLEFGFIYDDDERLNFPLFMDENEKTPGTRSSTFIYEGATEIDISATAVLRDFLTHPRVLEKCRQLDVLAPSSTSEKPVLRKFLLSNVTKTPWDSSARTKIARPSLECVSKDLLDIVQTIEREVVVANTKTTTASLLLKQIYERELARYSATTIAEDLTTLRIAREREARDDENENENRRRRRFLVALKLRLSEKILLRACVDDLETTIIETDDDG